MTSLTGRIAAPSIVVDEATIAEIIELRRGVHTQLPDGRFEDDELPTTQHFAAYSEGEDGEKVGKPVACVSFFYGDHEGYTDHEKRSGFLVRGITTAVEHRGNGYAERLLAEAVNSVAQATSIRHFWCNSRTSAMNVYRRCGWRRTQKPTFTVKGISEGLNEMEITV